MLALALTGLTASAARAQSDEDRATARALADDAQQALERKDYARAIDLFTRARTLVGAPTLELGLARAQAAAGQLVQAHETYQRIVVEGAGAGAPPAFRRAVEDARRELAILRPRLPFVIVDVTGPSGAEVTLDGAVVPKAALGVRRALNPGHHLARATAPGHFVSTRAFDVAEGASVEIRLALVPDGARTAAATPRAGWVRRAAWAGVGAGGAALAFGGLSGAVALSRRSDLDARCPGGSCPADALGAVQGYQDLGALAWAGLATAGVLGGGGTALLATTRRERDERPLSPALVGAGVGGLAFGGVAGVMALGVRGDLEAACGSACPATERDRVTSYRTLATASLLGLGLGAASAGAGVTLALLRPGAAPTVTPTIGAGTVALRGGF